MNKTEVMFMFGGASMGTLVHTTLLYGLVMFASQVWKQINLLLRCQHWVHKMCHGIRGRIGENTDEGVTDAMVSPELLNAALASPSH